MNLLEIKNLNFKYDNEYKSSAFSLADISLDIKKGSIVTVCGPTGCGKSTLLKLIKKEIAPKGELTGQIIFNGKNINDQDDISAARDIALLFQNPEDQIVTDKVWHELAYGLENLGYDKETIENRIAEIIAFFRLEHIALKETASLSGGQKQILLLASLLAMSPQLLLLDEPISQLDPEATEQFLNLLKRLHDQLGITIIMAEHKLDNVLPISDTLVVMDKGKVISCGSPDEVKEDYFKVLPPLLKTTKPPLSKKTYSPSVLSLKSLYYRYNSSENDIISNLSADFKKGHCYAIFGCNAAGKTTLFNIISGLLKAQEGHITPTLKKIRVSYLPQNPELLFVGETVEKDLSLVGLSKKDYPSYLERIDTQQSPFDLSGGEKQLVSFAKITAVSPEVILLDEPTKGLDSNMSNIIAEEVKRFTENGTTVIMSTHDLAFASVTADMCAILSMGRITAFKQTKEFFDNNRLYSI